MEDYEEVITPEVLPPGSGAPAPESDLFTQLSGDTDIDPAAMEVIDQLRSMDAEQLAKLAVSAAFAALIILERHAEEAFRAATRNRAHRRAILFGGHPGFIPMGRLATAVVQNKAMGYNTPVIN